MYRRRLYIFIFLCFLAVSVCFVRLGYMQIIGKEEARETIRKSRIRNPWQLPTVRGSIYDRNEKELAADKPRFYVQISYQLTRFLDKNFWTALIKSNARDDKSPIEIRDGLHAEYAEQIDAIYNTIDKCSKLLQVDREIVIAKIGEINEGIWSLRENVAWRNTFPESELILEYKKKGYNAPHSKAMVDFEELLAAKGFDDPYAERCKLALKEDLAEAHQLYPIYEIRTREQLLDVQLEFTGVSGVEITPISERVYRYGASACNLIGWVGPAQEEENTLFPDDIYSRYNAEDYSGKNGIEETCEVILRGKRGEVTYNRDDELLSRKPTQFGEDIHLSIDIELQFAIEKYLSDKTVFPDPNAAMGSVVIDVASGEILAMVSIPTYDIRFIRRASNYNAVNTAPTQPFKNKTLWETYPPGSIVKPLFLAIGLETGNITAEEIISCPGTKPPKGWPDCIIHRDFGSGHDTRWYGLGGNIGRNAIRGSCNIYFSRLADRMSPMVIQGWLYRFGFGHRILTPPNYPALLEELKRSESEGVDRRLLEADGVISSSMPKRGIEHILELPPLNKVEKKFFGIGQGSMRVTVLQVANAMAALARGGVYKAPRLFIGDTENKDNQPVPIGISDSTLRVVRDGMSAVVYESGGTAYTAFKNGKYGGKFEDRKIKVFGKTGSTEKPYNAWFAGFAEDDSGRALAFAIIVKKGQSGSKDAAPKGLKILDMCNEMDYIGVSPDDDSGKD